MSFPITTLEDADIDAVQGGATSGAFAEQLQKMQDFRQKIAASQQFDKLKIAARLRLALAGSAAPTSVAVGAGSDVGAQGFGKRAIV